MNFDMEIIKNFFRRIFTINIGEIHMKKIIN